MKSDVFLSSPKSYQKFGYLINKIYDQEHLKITHLVTVSYHIIISRMINVKNIYEEIRHKPWSSGLGIKPMLLYEETEGLKVVGLNPSTVYWKDIFHINLL